MAGFNIRWLQKIQIYKTQKWLYMIGSNLSETKFKVLKIDREVRWKLNIVEDQAEYNAAQIQTIIKLLYSGNNGTAKWKKSSVDFSVAHGIVGFVRFLEGYYAIFITKQSKVAEIGGHSIYKIEDTSMLYIPNHSARDIHPDETRYLKMFQTVDLSSDFYFSYSYDLTNSLQYNMIQLQKSSEDDCKIGENDFLTALPNNETKIDFSRPCPRFVWNSYMTEVVASESVKSLWISPIIHGHVTQSRIDVYGQQIYVTLIGRRSSVYAGTRFLKRGCNIKGDVANEVETEQIVHCASMSSLRYTPFTSFMQHRGSVPLHWEQVINANVVPSKPPITITYDSPYSQATACHFRQMFERFGSPIMVLNLVRKRRRERKQRESILGQNFKNAVEYLNQFLAPGQQIKYLAIDMAHLARGRRPTALITLAGIAQRTLSSTGFFQSKPNLFKDTLSQNSKWQELGGHHAYGYRLQTGVLRTNCVDCLDRTNSAQFIVGKCALAYQLFSLGVLTEPDIDFETDVIRLYEEMFEEHGDIVALQYGGSQLVHTIQSYRRTVAPWASHSRDIVTSISRYYTNTFSDADKQAAMNLFLGVFRPSLSRDHLWDISTDHYLHNLDADVLSTFFAQHYTRWWDPDAIRALPLPYDLVKKANSSTENTNVVDWRGKESDWYDDLYRPFQLTLFDELFNINMKNTHASNFPPSLTDESPFAVRSENFRPPEPSHSRSSLSSSQTSLDLSSNESSDSEAVEAGNERNLADSDHTQSSSLPPWLRKPTLAELSPEAVYGIDLDHVTTRADIDFYEDYVSCMDLNKPSAPADHRGDFVDVEPPTVDLESMKLYEESVNHTYKPDLQFYIDYLSAHRSL